MWPFLGALAGGAMSLAGGFMGANNQSQQFWQNVKMSNRAFRASQKWNRLNQKFSQHWNTISQNNFLQQLKRATTKWRVGDAKRAGIHPLYALGGGGNAVSGPSFSVGGGSSVAGGLPGYSGDSLGPAMSSAGQSIGRAVEAMATHDQRAENRIMTALSIEKMGLENEYIRSQIRRTDAQTGPALPRPGQTYMIDGQGNTVRPVNLDPVIFSQRYPEAKQNVQLGDVWQANPYVSNAEDVEARHGELADMLWGAVTIPSDIYWNNRDSFWRGVDWLRNQTLEGRR